MSLLDVLRKGVAVADKVTKPLQATVTFERDLGNDEYGRPSFSNPVSMKAIVDWKQKQLRTATGVLTVSRASVLFLDINQVVAVTAGRGISDTDKITLPDGTTGPILDMSGFVDAGTTHPICTEVWLG